MKEVDTAAFKKYGAQIVKNTKVLVTALQQYDFDLVSGGSDNHLILIDLKNKDINGAVAALALEVAGIVVNKNGVPFDTMPPFYPSGIRLGTPAITTRGIKEKEMKQVGEWINRALTEVSGFQMSLDKEERRLQWQKYKALILKNKKLVAIGKEVKQFCTQFPL
jgi:glycine hydroxymethyltransferase